MIHHRERLAGCDPRLVTVAEAVRIDFCVVCGERDRPAQELALAEKRSTVGYPDSKHNRKPPEREFSEALDFCPWPVPTNWEAKDAIARFYILAGAFMQAAATLGIPLRWGGDWDGDGDLKDQSFNDLGHVELLQRGNHV